METKKEKQGADESDEKSEEKSEKKPKKSEDKSKENLATTEVGTKKSTADNSLEWRDNEAWKALEIMTKVVENDDDDNINNNNNKNNNNNNDTINNHNINNKCSDVVKWASNGVESVSNGAGAGLRG